MPAGAVVHEGLVVAAAAVVTLVAFVVAAVWIAKDAAGVRMSYFCSVLFLAVLIGLAALAGLGRAVGVAIANPRGGVECRGIRNASFSAQRPFPSFAPPDERPPRFQFPTIPPIPEPPGEQAPPRFRIVPDCSRGPGRSRAAAGAIRSGIMLVAAGVLVRTHLGGMRRLAAGEDRSG